MTEPLDITSTINGSKWHHGLGAAQLAELNKYAESITEEVHTAVTAAAKGQIRIGSILLKARALFPSDGQFGKWRQENTPIGSKESANKLMNLAKQFDEGRITESMIKTLPISTLKELLTAPDNVIQAVAKRVDEGDAPTKTEARQMVKDARQEDRTEMMDDLDNLDEDREPMHIEYDLQADLAAADRAAGGPDARDKQKKTDPKGPSAPAKPTAPMPNLFGSMRNAIETILAMEFVDRVVHLTKNNVPYANCSEIEWAWMVFGLDPTPASNPSYQTVQFLYERYYGPDGIESAPDYESAQHTLELAHNIIDKEY